jgi:hypothetical protein
VFPGIVLRQLIFQWIDELSGHCYIPPAFSAPAPHERARGGTV